GAQRSKETPITNSRPRIPERELRITNYELRITNSPTAFEDVSHLIHHTHHEEEFNDFERQPLLPHKLSQLGPGVSWSDVDGDGREDLLVGSGRGGQLEIFLNQGKGQFQRLPMGALVGRAGDDQTT